MKHSINLSALLVGVDFTKKGEFVSDSGETIKYGDSVKLKVNIARQIDKQGIKTQITDQFTLQLPVDVSIDQDVEKYNKLIGKTLEAPIFLKSDLTFKTSGVKIIG